jgi:hypothetical protein
MGSSQTMHGVACKNAASPEGGDSRFHFPRGHSRTTQGFQSAPRPQDSGPTHLKFPGNSPCLMLGPERDRKCTHSLGFPFWASPEPLLCPQVSHHPPVSAFHVSNRKDGFCISGSITAKSRFYGEGASPWVLSGPQGRGEDWAPGGPQALLRYSEHVPPTL